MDKALSKIGFSRFSETMITNNPNYLVANEHLRMFLTARSYVLP